MNIAFITLQGRGLIDDCLAEAVALMEARGVRLSGTIRALPVNHRAHPCDMDVRVLPDGPLHRISQVLGAASRGCRLDPGAIERLSADVEARLSDGDLLVINKFGKQESLGRGLRPAIAKAVEHRIPVLVGVNGLNLPDFEAFTSGLATRLPPDPLAILAWSLRSIQPVGETTG
jgi:hypothetical protein